MTDEKTRELPEWLTDDDRRAMREPLERDVKAWKQQWQALDIERRAKEAQLNRQHHGHARAERHPFAYDGQGQRIDWGKSAKNELIKRLASIDFEQETLEGSIREAIQELDALPRGAEDNAADEAAGASATAGEADLDDESGGIVPIGRSAG